MTDGLASFPAAGTPTAPGARRKALASQRLERLPAKLSACCLSDECVHYWNCVVLPEPETTPAMEGLGSISARAMCCRQSFFFFLNGLFELPECEPGGLSA